MNIVCPRTAKSPKPGHDLTSFFAIKTTSKVLLIANISIHEIWFETKILASLPNPIISRPTPIILITALDQSFFISKTTSLIPKK